MNYDDLYTVLKNASAATLAKFERSSKAARAFVQRYHMWRFVVQREYELQYGANYDKKDPTHMRPQMREFLDSWSMNKGDEGTYWKRFYEFLDKTLYTWIVGAELGGFTTSIERLRAFDVTSHGRLVRSVTIFLPEIKAAEFTPGLRIAMFALDYVKRKDLPEEEEDQIAFEVVVNDQADGLALGRRALKRRVADSEAIVDITLPPDDGEERVAPDGRFKIRYTLSRTTLAMHAFFFKDLATTEKLVSHAIQASFWI